VSLIPFDPDRPLYGSSEPERERPELDNDEYLRFQSEMAEERERNWREMQAQELALEFGGVDMAIEERLKIIRETRTKRGPL
jgi:hypothetical protein